MKNFNSTTNQSIKSQFVSKNVICRLNEFMELYQQANQDTWFEELENLYYYSCDLHTGNTELDYDEKEELKEIFETAKDAIYDLIYNGNDNDLNFEAYESEVLTKLDTICEGEEISLKDIETTTKDRNFEGFEDIEEYIQEIHDKLEEDVETLEDAESEMKEVYEWWAVDSYLYKKLAEKGEVVTETQDFYVWGRCTTGQSILLDHVISLICEDMEILEGQANSWAK